jgi:DNA polymerase alpha subunit A
MNYEVEEVHNVFDVVDEGEYAETVSRKREEDWIVDDDGGYVEDGREIFDDEEGDLGFGDSAEGGRTKTKDKVKGEKAKKEGVKSSNIKNMLLAMPSKAKTEDRGKLEDDEDLGDILKAITEKKAAGGAGTKKAAAARPGPRAGGEAAEAERNPFMKRGTGLKKTVRRQPAARPTAEETGGEAPPGQEEPEQAGEEVVEGFEDDMDFDEEMTEETVAKAEEVKVEDSANRGFVAAALESGRLGSGQWVSSGGRAQVREEEVAVDSSSLPTVTVEEDGEQKEVLRMYWLDAHEDPYKNPGTVWLFGKVAVQSAFVSCCVTVKNVPRRVYLAMRETNSKTGEAVTGMDLYNEFNTKVAKRYKINDFKCRPVEKSYAFEHSDLPNHGTYLEVVYGSQYPALPADLSGDTFSRLLGSPQAALEMLLLHQRIKGPGWLDIHSAVPVSAQVTAISGVETIVGYT